MEDPKTINRFLLICLSLAVVALIGASLFYHDLELFMWGAVALLLAVLACFAAGLVQAIVFGPILWFASKLMGRQRRAKEPNSRRTAS